MPSKTTRYRSADLPVYPSGFGVVRSFGPHPAQAPYSSSLGWVAHWLPMERPSESEGHNEMAVARVELASTAYEAADLPFCPHRYEVVHSWPEPINRRWPPSEVPRERERRGPMHRTRLDRQDRQVLPGSLPVGCLAAKGRRCETERPLLQFGVGPEVEPRWTHRGRPVRSPFPFGVGPTGHSGEGISACARFAPPREEQSEGEKGQTTAEPRTSRATHPLLVTGGWILD